jgi:multiple sugar transport system permease protein
MTLQRQRRLRLVVVYAILAAWSLWLAFPLYWLVIAAFKTPLAQSQRATYIPFVDFQPTLAAWANVFGQSGGLDPRAPFGNSVVISCR